MLLLSTQALSHTLSGTGKNATAVLRGPQAELPTASTVHDVKHLICSV